MHTMIEYTVYIHPVTERPGDDAESTTKLFKDMDQAKAYASRECVPGKTWFYEIMGRSHSNAKGESSDSKWCVARETVSSPPWSF